MKFTKPPRTVYIYSKADRNYLIAEYIDLFKEKNAILKRGTKESFEAFVENNKDEMQLDTETNVTDFYTERVLYVLQLGNIDGSEQHIMDWNSVPKFLVPLVPKLLASETTFLAHYAVFEYMILYKTFGIYIRNFKDTFLASKIITSGLDVPKGYNSLANLLKLAFGIDLSKEEQTGFTTEMMTPNQLLYADTDVLYLGKLLKNLMIPLKRWGLTKVFHLENKALRPIGDMTINGFNIDTVALDENIILYEQNALDTRQEMIDAFSADKTEGVQERLREIGVIQKQDEVIINWKSSVQKRAILNYLYPDFKITSTAKPILIKLEKIATTPYLKYLLDGNVSAIETFLVSRHIEFLKEQGMFIAKGTLNMNFNSPAQLLEFFKIWHPTLTSTGEKVLRKIKTPVVMAFKKYTKASKLVSSFGRKMYTFIESDGRIHGSFTQLVPTGSRMSSSKPNMQQAPSNEQFRRMYIPSEGGLLVDTDYASAELVLAAYLSKDKKMLWAIKEGLDLHSYSAYQIFGQRWLDAGGDEVPRGKPSTREANNMRKQAKGCSFSILYGTGVMAFSENAGLTLKEGKAVLKAYGETFPELIDFFNKSGQDALRDNYVREPFYKRVRFFNKPKNGIEASHNKNAAMNYKPQAANGSITKHAMCIIKKHIEDNGLDAMVKILLAVHDEVITEVLEASFAKEWAVTQTRLMEQATWFAIPDKALKAETDILEHWTKG